MIASVTDTVSLDIDQNPRRYDRFELYQGIANLAPKGPEDGGLVVLKGSHRHHEEHFAQLGGFRPEQDSGEKENGYLYIPEDADWYRAKGCEEVKVCAGEGDLICEYPKILFRFEHFLIEMGFHGN